MAKVLVAWMMEFAECEARRRGLVRVELYTNEVMTENVGLYEHLGCVEVRRAFDAGYRRVFMEKRLIRVQVQIAPNAGSSTRSFRRQRFAIGQDAGVITRAVWLNGTVGVGKTTVAGAIAERLAADGDAVAFIDSDSLGDLSIRPPDDPFNTRLVAKNLAAVVANFSATGARSLVVAGVIQARRDLEMYQAAIPVPVTLVRLIVSARDLEVRLQKRHGEFDPDGLRWHLDRAPTLAAILETSGLTMVDVANVGHPDDTASAALAAARWDPET